MCNNREVKWHNIPISIKICRKCALIFHSQEMIETSITAKAHFGGQDTLGVVKALTECSDQPAARTPMVILPACNMDSSTISRNNCLTITPPVTMALYLLCHLKLGEKDYNYSQMLTSIFFADSI